MSARLPKKQPSSLTPAGKVRPGLMFEVPLSDGARSLGFVRATNVFFGSVAILLFDESVSNATNTNSHAQIETGTVIAFLLTWPNPIQDGTWSLVPRDAKH